MRTRQALSLLLLGLATALAQAWGSHSASSYRAFERMPEVSMASVVTVEPLEAFLRAEEYTIEALLAGQEAWALVNLEKYPMRPPALAFNANPARSDETRRLAFLGALRVAPNSKFALYFEPDPWNPSAGTPLPYSAVNTLPEPTPAVAVAASFLALKPGDQVTALTVLATAADEPDYGIDINLWDDSPSEWGRTYGFGPQPFGNRALSYTSQVPFHMGFMHEGRFLYLAAPYIKRSFPLLRSHQFSTLAALAFRTGHGYWGWRFAGLSLHYLQDLTQPYHTSLAPGESRLKLLGANALAMAGLPGMKNDLIVLLSNRHLALEKYQSEWLQIAASSRQEGALEKALHATERDRSYPEWSDHYLRDVVSQQACTSATQLAQALVATLSAANGTDPSVDWGTREAGVMVLQDTAKRQTPERSKLDAAVAELSANFGAHSRNAVRGILRASSPP
jgi:hypothetical protein